MRPAPATPDDYATMAVAYVRFALDHPALFRAMFTEPCDPDNQERPAANAAIAGYVDELVRRALPTTGADSAAVATAVWALVHGLAFPRLDGKLDTATPDGMATRVDAVVRALLARLRPRRRARSRGPPAHAADTHLGLRRAPSN